MLLSCGIIGGINNISQAKPLCIHLRVNKGGQIFPVRLVFASIFMADFKMRLNPNQIVTNMPIATQRLGKHIPVVYAINNRTSIAR
jgi:hypothetical protein